MKEEIIQEKNLLNHNQLDIINNDKKLDLDRSKSLQSVNEGDTEIQHLLNGQWAMNGSQIDKVQSDNYPEKNTSEQKAGLKAGLLSNLYAIPRCVWDSGPWSIAVAAFLYSITLLTVKLVSDKVQIFEILITRSFVSLIISLFVSWKSGIKPIYGQYKHYHILIGRAFFGSIAFMSFYYSVDLLPVGDATAIFFLNAATTAILGWLILGQKITLFGLVGIICSIVGVMFVAHPPFLFGGHQEWGSQRIMGVFLGMFSSFMAAWAFVMVRLIGKRESPLTISLWFHTASLTGIIPVVLGYPRKPVIPNAHEIFMLSIISLGSFFAQLMLTRGFQQDKASRIAAINYLQVAFGYVWGLIFLRDPIMWYGVLGAVFIAIGVFLVNKEPVKKGNEMRITDSDLQLFENETISHQTMSFQLTNINQESQYDSEDIKIEIEDKLTEQKLVQNNIIVTNNNNNSNNNNNDNNNNSVENSIAVNDMYCQQQEVIIQQNVEKLNYSDITDYQEVTKLQHSADIQYRTDTVTDQKNNDQLIKFSSDNLD